MLPKSDFNFYLKIPNTIAKQKVGEFARVFPQLFISARFYAFKVKWRLV